MGKVITHNKQSLIKGKQTFLNQLGKKQHVYKNDDQQIEILTFASSLHEWNYQNATEVGTTSTAVDTGSVGGLNLINPSAASQIGINTGFDFGGTPEIIINETNTFRNSDTTGAFHFKFYAVEGVSQLLFSMSKDTRDDSWIYISKTAGNQMQFLSRMNGGYSGLILTSNAIIGTGLYTASIYHNGTRADWIIEGVKQTTYTQDYLSQYWIKRYFDTGAVIDNIAMGGIYDLVPSYGVQVIKWDSYNTYSDYATTLGEHNLIRTTNF